jgi:glutamate-1-semialdehyde 2,1-aminomutase
MFSSVAFAAGIATIDIYERDNVFDHITAMGQQLVDGITKVGLEAGHEDILMSGPPTMPNLLFKNDQKAKRARAFGGLSSRYGAIFHPTLNWFLCYAHKQADIEEAIDIARRAFEQTPTSVELL